MKKQFKNYSFTIIKTVDTDYTIEGIFSTANTDRHGDIVQQNWDLKNFIQNPVILNSHNYDDVAEIVGKVVDIGLNPDSQLAGKIKFAVNENPKARIIYELYKNGFANAFSVGFIPKDFGSNGEITLSELLEISVVSVPANAMALAKAKGIDTTLLEEEQKDEKNNEQNIADDKDEEDNEQGTPTESDDSETGTDTSDEDEAGDSGENNNTEEEDIENKAIDYIYKAVKLLRVSKTNTRDNLVRAKENRIINKAIRELIAHKRK